MEEINQHVNKLKHYEKLSKTAPIEIIIDNGIAIKGCFQQQDLIVVAMATTLILYFFRQCDIM